MAPQPSKGPWELDETARHPWKVVAAYEGPPLGDEKATIVEVSYRPNAVLIAAAPDLRDQVEALTLYGWEVEKVSLYDEEGVEGWAWSAPDGREFHVIGHWDEPPPWPDEARDHLRSHR